jgi:hypothetical protein
MPRKGSVLGSKPDKRGEENPRNIGGIMETLPDAMENSILGNPIEENTLAT